MRLAPLPLSAHTNKKSCSFGCSNYCSLTYCWGCRHWGGPGTRTRLGRAAQARAPAHPGSRGASGCSLFLAGASRSGFKHSCPTPVTPWLSCDTLSCSQRDSWAQHKGSGPTISLLAFLQISQISSHRGRALQMSLTKPQRFVVAASSAT